MLNFILIATLISIFFAVILMTVEKLLFIKSTKDEGIFKTYIDLERNKLKKLNRASVPKKRVL